MSAIAGILHFGGSPLAPDLIARVTAAMARRGPDAQVHWAEGSVALGHCMLRTTPESMHEHQPLASPDKKRVLVWDGRLDNRDEIRRDLVSKGAVLRDDTDAELVLQSYAVWGRECPARLLGDFAFAVWDAERRHLFCARDHIAARPFYYVHNDRLFAFASDDEALLGLPGVSSLPDEELVAYLLVPSLEDVNVSDSYFRDVHALAPATSIVIEPSGTFRTDTYWKLEPGEESRYATDKECEEAFLQVFGKAVHCRMRSTGDVAGLMSGGMDSAAILAMARRLLAKMPGRELHTYSAISDTPNNCVETQCIQSMARSLQTHAHFVSVPSMTGMLSVQDLIDTAWGKVHPLDNSILLPMLMFLAASRDGHRVLLHGVSGDIAMQAPERYPAYLMRQGRWGRAWQECRGASCNHTYLQGRSPAKLFLQNLGTAYAPIGIKKLVRRLRKMGKPTPLQRSVINPEFAARLGVAERLRANEHAGWVMPRLPRAYAQSMYAPSCGIMLGLALYEHAAGRFGLELRDPWADKRVIEFFMSLPLEYKVRDGWLKYLPRSAFAEDLGDEVAWRVGKEHLGWQIMGHVMDESRDRLAKAMGGDLDKISGYINIDAVRARYRGYLGNNDPREREFLYEILSLLFFMQRFS